MGNFIVSHFYPIGNFTEWGKMGHVAFLTPAHCVFTPNDGVQMGNL